LTGLPHAPGFIMKPYTPEGFIMQPSGGAV
jgi:hypothetical protein